MNKTGQSIMLWFSFFPKKSHSITFLYIYCKKDLGFFSVVNLRQRMTTENAPKRAHKFYCEYCDYNTSKTSDWKRHLSTDKHENNAKTTIATQNAPKTPTYDCPTCNKPHNDRAGLWRHKKKCIQMPSQFITIDVVMEIMKQNKEVQNILIEQHKEAQNVLIEQNNKLMEKITVLTQGNTITNSHNTNSNNNNSFNLNFFLNEQCKNAVNLADFIESLQVGVKDLEKTGRMGYVEGISSIFLNGLRELDVYSRPIHCTDLKRETVYVKDQDKWEKENEEKPRLKNAVKRIATKNLRQLPAWEKENPEFSDFSSKESELYLTLSKNSLGGYDKEEDTKYQDNIIRNVLKETKVPT